VTAPAGHAPRKGDRFRHARQLDTSWRPGPGQRYADAPHAVMVVTRVVRRGPAVRVWYGVDAGEGCARGAFVADLAGLDDVVAEWLPR
jgi:hypothetical protein